MLQRSTPTHAGQVRDLRAGSSRRAALQGLAGGALLALSGAAPGWRLPGFAPGAGFLHLHAPRTVRAGAAFEVKVQAGVWGEGREPAKRYSAWSMVLFQDGTPLGPAIAPSRIATEPPRLSVWFAAVAPSTSAAQVLTWRVRFRFDGQDSDVPGPESIAVVT